MRSKNLIFKDFQSRASQLGSDTLKCETKSHGNVQVLNLFARPFSVHVVQSVLLWGKEPIVLIKSEEVNKTNQREKRTSSAKEEEIAPKCKRRQTACKKIQRR